MVQVIRKYYDQLSGYHLTDYEKLRIAAEMQRNDIMQSAFAVSSDNSSPSALEKIAMELQSIGESVSIIAATMGEE